MTMNTNIGTNNAFSEEVLTINLIKSNPAVHLFIEKVLVQLYTEEDANAIQDELTDHLYSLALDYYEAGHTVEASIHKALLQMGDPTEIGYSFTDYDAMKKRRRLLITFKALGILVLITTLTVTFILSAQTDSNSQNNDTTATLSEYAQLQLNVTNYGAIETFFSYVSYYTKRFSSDFFYFLYFPLIFLTNIRQFQLAGIPIKRLDISKEPLLILWPYKKSFPWEYFLITLFFVPIIIVFIILMVSEGVYFLSPVAFIASVSFSFWLYFHSEVFRIPKYMVLDDGILIKNRLITWASIDKISWIHDYASKGNHYKLIIENKTIPGSNYKISRKRTVYVNRNQHTQLANIFNCHLK